MTQSEIYKLINKQIDGEITVDEKDTLDHILISDEKNRHKYENLQKTADVLERIPLVEPPASLANDILAQIDGYRYKRSASTWKTLNTHIIDFIKPRQKMAIAFAAGLLLGAVVVGLFNQSDPYSALDITGAIGTDETSKIQQIKLESEVVSGLFRLEPQTKGIICQAEINTLQPFDLVIEIDTPAYHVVEYEAKSLNPVYLKSNSDGIRISGESSTELKLFINAEDERPEGLTIQIISNDKHLSQTILF